MTALNGRGLPAIHIAGHLIGYIAQGAKAEALLWRSSNGNAEANTCGEYVCRGQFYMPLGLNSRAAWRNIGHQDLRVTALNMSREISAVLSGPIAEAMSSFSRSRSKTELRSFMRALPGSESDLAFCTQVLNELKALTGFGSQKAFEERTIEFVESRLAIINQLAMNLGSTANVMALLEKFTTKIPQS